MSLTPPSRVLRAARGARKDPLCTYPGAPAGRPEHAVTAAELVRTADRTLYLAKAAGRNRAQVGADLAVPAMDPAGESVRAMPVLELEAADRPIPLRRLDDGLRSEVSQDRLGLAGLAGDARS